MQRDRMTAMKYICGSVLVSLIVMCGEVGAAHAQNLTSSTSSCGESASSKQLLGGTLRDFRRVPSRKSLEILALGGVAAAGAHSIDRSVTKSFSNPGSVRESLEPGAFLGGTPFELGTSFTAYAIGRALHRPCVANVAADLVRAQL